VGRLALAGSPQTSGAVRLCRAHDTLLGVSCVLRYAPADSPAALAVLREAAALADLDHPWLAPVLYCFREVEPALLPSSDAPIAGFAVHWDPAPPITELLGEATPEMRLRALCQVLAVWDYFLRRGVPTPALHPDAVQMRGAEVRVLPVGLEGPPAGGASSRPDGLATLCRELLADCEPDLCQPFRSLADADPAAAPAPAEVLAALRDRGLDVPWVHGSPPLVGREPSVRALREALAGELVQPAVLVGRRGSGRTRVARAALSAIAARDRLSVLDLTRADAPLPCLHRLLFPDGEVAPRFDDAWAAAARQSIAEAPPGGAVFFGRLEDLSPEEGELVEEIARAMAASGLAASWAATRPSPDATSLPLRPLGASDAALLADFHRVPLGPRVRATWKRTGGWPGSLVHALQLASPEGSGMPAEAEATLLLLASLPDGIPPRVVSGLPAEHRRALPLLSRRGYLWFDRDGLLFRDPLRDPGRIDPKVASLVAPLALDPLGESDPLWRALLWLRMGDTARASVLFTEAAAAAGDREDALLELAAGLARAGHPDAILAFARIRLHQDLPSEALSALSALTDPTTEAHALRIRALRHAGEPGRAAADARAVLSGEDHPAVWLELSRALLALGDLKGAKEALSRASKDGESPLEAEHLAVRAALAVRRLRTGAELEDLPALIEQVAGLEEGPARVLGSVGWILARIGEDVQAADLLERAATAAEREGMLLNATLFRVYRGQACQRLGMGDEARQVWLEALATAQVLGLPPLLRRLRYLLARLEIRLGRLEAAEHHRRQLRMLADSVSDPDVQATAGIVDAWCELANGHPEAALIALDQVDPKRLSEPQALAYAIPRGLALLETGRLAEARQIVDTASIPAHPEDTRRLLSLRGRVYVALGRHYLREARDRLPETPRPLERQEVGEILLACAGEDLDTQEFADRARDLERAAQLLSGPTAERAERVRGHLVTGAAGATHTQETPPFETRAVLGVLLSNPKEAEAIETTIAMLDPQRNNNLLLTGATGVGKRVFAERLAVEVLGLTGLEEVVLRRTDPQMLVSMLMGTRKGEFTGALDQQGAIDRAIKGRKALLLDELHTLDRTGQEILLPLLELPRRRFGGLMRSARDIRGPLQIMLATNVDLSGSRWRDLFRSDLWYRMSQLHVHLPPLAARGTEAIYRYLQEMLAEAGLPNPEDALEPRAIHALLAHPWEGNLRELHTVASRISRFRHLHARRVTVDDLPRLAGGTEIEAISPFGTRDVLETLELNAVVEALRRCNWSQKAAAERLAISKYRLYRILQKHDLVQWLREKRSATDSGKAGA